MFENVMQASLLYDFYGSLLSNRQAEVMRLYHEENLSLAEIASEFNITRQGVYDSLKNAEKTLREYESKLHMMESFQRTLKIVRNVELKIDDIMASSSDTQLKGELEQLKEELKKIDI